MIILELEVVAKGTEVGTRLGNPQTLKPGQGNASAPSTNENQPPPANSTANSVKSQGG